MRLVRLLIAACLGLTPAIIVRPAAADALSTCTFTMTEVAFGQVNILPGTAVNTNGILSIRCPQLTSLIGTSLSVCITFPTPRRLQGSSTTLNYDFLGPLPAVTTWSSSTPTIVLLTSLLNGATASVTIPSTILASQSTAPPGYYSANITASVSYGLLGCSLGMVYQTSFNTLVDGTVSSACTVVANAIAFGSKGLLTTVVDAAGQITTQCTSGTSYTIGLDGGSAAATDPTKRRMQPVSGTGSVTYGLYQDMSRTVPWGNSIGSNTVGRTGTALTQMTPVYGRVPIQATPAPGAYSDTIVVTTTY